MYLKTENLEKPSHLDAKKMSQEIIINPHKHSLLQMNETVL